MAPSIVPLTSHPGPEEEIGHTAADPFCDSSTSHAAVITTGSPAVSAAHLSCNSCNRPAGLQPHIRASTEAS